MPRDVSPPIPSEPEEKAEAGKRLATELARAQWAHRAAKVWADAVADAEAAQPKR